MINIICNNTSNKKALVCILFFYFLPINTIFGETTYRPNNSYPFEFKILISSLFKSNLQDQDLKKLKRYILIIDNIPEYLTKKEVLFFIKTEIYKTILEEGISDRFKVKQPDKDLLTKFKALKKNISKYNSFSQYIIESIERDFEYLLASPFYKNIIFKKVKTQEDGSKGVQKISRNFTLLYHWFETIRDYSVTDFNQLAHRLSFKILKRISENSQLFIVLSSLKIAKKNDLNQLKYFTKQLQIEQKKELSPMENFIKKEGPINSPEREKKRQQNSKEWVPKDSVEGLSSKDK